MHDRAFVRGEDGQNRQHQFARRGCGIEFLRHAADTHTVLFELANRVQDQPRVSAEAIQAVDQDLIELAQAGVSEKPATSRSLLHRKQT
jgi:hypothetical protein